MGRGGSETALLLPASAAAELQGYLGSSEQENVLLEGLQEIAPGLETVFFKERGGHANFDQGVIAVPAPRNDLSALENLVSITQTAVHEAGHFRYTGRQANELLDIEEQRFAQAGAAASWQQMLDKLMALEDARMTESLAREWPQLEMLFRAEGALDRRRRAVLNVSGKPYLEYHFGVLDATDPYSTPPAGVGRDARKLSKRLREVFEFAVGGETTASAVLASAGVAETMVGWGCWYRAFDYGKEYLEDAGESIVGWADETIEWAKDTSVFNSDRVRSWKQRRGPLNDAELQRYLAGLAGQTTDPAELQRLLLPRL